ncbi:CLAVATA3/ESR-related protein 40 [Prunus dulcis]|uniref:CLAVATA3/ESR-related protein 40 n=1 Tax=Prunus dulcis TaxID=3755 RepID=A0A4Y1RKE4_PRUDU|nr:CLAVATA3/ESR-related protein 40 [Prunus dulcis]
MGLQVRTFTLTENNTNTNTKGLQINQADRFGNGEGAKVFNAVEDSARQVPAGPDPLHHNNNPLFRES